MESATAATAASTATAAAAATSLASLGLVDTNGSSVELGSVHLFDGLIGSAVVGKSHEAEATRTTSLTVEDDRGLFDLSELGEGLVETRVIRAPTEATNE